MAELTRHWTERDIDSFVFRIGADFVRQLQKRMDSGPGMSQAELAARLNVSEGRVSQILNNPGNLTLRKMVEYSRGLGLKVSVVAYDDHDPTNKNGPINSEIFAACWEGSGRPIDFFALRDSQQQVAVNQVMLRVYDWFGGTQIVTGYGVIGNMHVTYNTTAANVARPINVISADFSIGDNSQRPNTALFDWRH